MLTTQKIVESFQQSSGEISLDDAVERLIILERYEQAMAEIDEKRGKPHVVFMTEIKQWIQDQK